MDGQAGASFAAGLLSSYSQAYGQQQKDQQDSQDKERESALRILDLAAHNPNLNQEDYPVLIRKMLEVHGAKGKDLDKAASTIQTLFQPGTTDRPAQINQPTTRMSGAGMFDTTPTDSVQIGDSSVPIESPPAMNYQPAQKTAAVRFLTPDEMRARDIQDWQARSSVQDEFAARANARREKSALAEIDARGQLANKASQDKFNNSLLLVNAKDRNAETIKMRTLANEIATARGIPMDEAMRQAGEIQANDISTRALERNARIEVYKQTAAAIPQRLAQSEERLKAYETNLVKGGRNSNPNAPVIRLEMEKMRSSNTRIRQMLNQTPRAEMSKDELEELQGLEATRDASEQNIRGLAVAAPTGAQTAAPQRTWAGRVSSGGGKYAGQRMSRSNLPAAAQRLNMTPERAESYIKSQGGVIY